MAQCEQLLYAAADNESIESATQKKLDSEFQTLETSLLFHAVQSVRVYAAWAHARYRLALAERNIDRAKNLRRVKRLLRRLGRDKVSFARPYEALVHAAYACLKGNNEESKKMLRRAIQLGIDSTTLGLVAIAKYRLNQLAPDAAEKERIEAETFFKEQEVANPARRRYA